MSAVAQVATLSVKCPLGAPNGASACRGSGKEEVCRPYLAVGQRPRFCCDAKWSAANASETLEC